MDPSSQTTTLDIEGMSCAACASAVENRWPARPACKAPS